ncbi:MAG: hypothetical protein SGARI_004561 [Bacillariaceae sp.]
MIVCMILSANTTDRGCIEGTAALHAAGYLNLEKLRNATVEELMAIIRVSGINEVKARYLIDMAKACDLKGGSLTLPETFEALSAILGIGRKTAVLHMNECYGFFYGIGSDSHVFELSMKWGFLVQDDRSTQVKAEDAENALREWKN